MFTGIVTGIGVVTGVTPIADGVRLALKLPPAFPRPAKGDSVAIDGACLTAIETGGNAMAVEAIAETLRRTTLGRLGTGDRVNLEPALALGDRLAGHWVQGHVDGTGRLRTRIREGVSERFEIELEDPGLARYVVPKGSIAISGVSLTVGTVTGARFTVYLIPHTLAATVLGDLAPGDPVNVEVDILAKYVAQLIAPALDAAGDRGGAREAPDRDHALRAFLASGLVPPKERE
jgi:riboflavin synthase